MDDAWDQTITYAPQHLNFSLNLTLDEMHAYNVHVDIPSLQDLLRKIENNQFE